MHRDILLAIPIRLVGVPPIPGLAALRPVEHTVGVAFVAPAGRSFLHIRAGKTGRSRVPSGVCRSRHNITVGNQPGNRVDHDDLTSHLLSIAHSRCRPAAPFSVIDSQQSSGVVYQKTVAVQHTIFVVGPADVNDGIRPNVDRLVLKFAPKLLNEFDKSKPNFMLCNIFFIIFSRKFPVPYSQFLL